MPPRYPLAMLIVATGFVTSAPGAGDETPPLPARIDRVLERIQARELDSNTYSPWSIMHAMIPFGEEAIVFDAQRAERVTAVEYLLGRATHEGRRIYRDEDGVPRLPIHERVQHHVNQYLMGLALAGVSPQQSLVADSGRRFRVADLVSAAKLDFDENEEPGWTLVALSSYVPCGQAWIASNGREYRIDDVVRNGIERDPRREAEGGTHHLYGVAYAVRRCRGPEATWAEAEAYLARYVELARKYQQEDGAFSAALLEGSKPPGSPRELVTTTGHMLEWLTAACSAQELRQPWVRRAAERLCTAIERHPLDTFSDGGLYHAAHALRLYRDAIGAGSAKSLEPAAAQ